MIQVIDAHEDYLILRSDQTGQIYGARFVVERGLERLLAAPIAEFMSGEALKTQKPTTARKELPAAKRRNDGARRDRLSERARKALAWIREQDHPVSAEELRAAIPELAHATNVYGTMKQLERFGAVQSIEQASTRTNDGRRILIKTWMPSSEPSEGSSVPS